MGDDDDYKKGKKIEGKEDAGWLRPPVLDKDPHLCHPVPMEGHKLQNVTSAPDRKVFGNGKPVMTIGDKTDCTFKGGACAATGCTDYQVDGQPVSRLLDTTDHNTMPPQMAAQFGLSMSPLISTCTDMLIGGGTSVGNTKAATEACKRLNGGRKKPGKHGPGNQSYENCGDECVRMLVNARNDKKPGDKGYVTEDDAFYRGLAVGGSGYGSYKNEKEENVPFTDDPESKCQKHKADYEAAKAAADSSPEGENLRKAREARTATDMEIEQTQRGLDANKNRGTGGSEIGEFDNQAAKDAAIKKYEDRLTQLKQRRAEEDQKVADAEVAYYASQKDVVAKHDAYLKCLEKTHRARYENGPAKNAKKNTGGTSGNHRSDMLDSYGVPNTQVNAKKDPAAVETAVAQGKGVIVPMKDMPDENGNNMPEHIVVVTGYEYDENGKLKNVVYNDTVTGCGSKMDGDTFNGKVQDANANVTREKVW